MQFTPDQLHQLSQLGINAIPPKKTPNLIPLFSISTLTLISFGGLIFFKSKNSDTTSPPQKPAPTSNPTLPSPTQVPKSIQHYLLTSQQYFGQALQSQTNQPQLINYLNQSITSATSAITLFPSDYRGYYQRGRIYQSLSTSQPQLISRAISDFESARTLNPNLADITHQLASLYAKKGDVEKTISYLSQTILLDPTQAQSFYDLAKIQQQIGRLDLAVSTYNQLIPILTDPNQKIAVETEKSALEKLLTQNPAPLQNPSPSFPPPAISTAVTDPAEPLLQATINSNLIIAAPETQKNISLDQQTSSNSLSGTSLLPAGQNRLTLENSQITSTSQLYLTITKGGKNQVLKVISKATGSATIGLDSPVNQDIEFKWWITN